MTDNQKHVFQRNNYFTGKLLTTRDFKDEQRYFNEKRHLLNRLIHGYGIVWGLRVKAADNHVLHIESGVGLDEAGKEIVVGQPIEPDLRDLDVFPAGAENDPVLYLTLAYKDCPIEPMPAVLNGSCCHEECESNRMAEGYNLRLTNIAPKVDKPEWARHETTTLLHTDKLDLVRIVPRWIQADDAFQVVLRLTVLAAIPADETIVVQAEEQLPDSYTYLFKDNLAFKLTNVAAGTVFELTYVVRAGLAKMVATITGKLHLDDNGALQDLDSAGSDVSVHSHEEIFDQITAQHFADQHEGGWVAPEQSFIYLAKIEVKADRSIGKVLDFGRTYVYSNPLLAKLFGLEDSFEGKLLRHGLSHQEGGSDEINVSNLSGVLTEPQKVAVTDAGGTVITAASIQFVGDGVSVAQNDNVAVVTIPGKGAEPVQVNDVITGRVLFKEVKANGTRISPEIELPIKEPCAINLAVEYISKKSQFGVMGRLIDKDVNLTAIYDLKKFTFQILLQDQRSNNDEAAITYMIRYWVIPPSVNKDDMTADGDDLWYREYVLSRLILYRGRTSDQLSIDPLLKPIGRDNLEKLLARLAEDELVKKTEGSVFIAI
ncbi:hypothetical protein [Paenibacillus contaminans]|uniref:Uncharacterized protein n=1 Tax=Paenibacillus contaminans TaxID=450362 RepID=A0A329LUU0_9BACL|nr:hypothetical protein [Paenibacillus contaminans]RAV11474.1 hypothetical protein DQG23_36115 [Paenibacillus contaminans]